MDEHLLVEKLKKGDESAFKQIVEHWQEMVYNTILGIVQNTEDAEDLSQEVFVQVYQSISSFKGDSKLSTWLYRIAISKALDHERWKKRKKRFGFIKSIFGNEDENEGFSINFVHPGVVMDRKEDAAMLFDAIKKLPDNQRIAFTLHKIEGLSYAAISEIMDSSVSAVESLMHRAKSNLRKLLEKNYRQV